MSKHQFKGTVVSNFLDSVSSQYPGLLILNKHPDCLTEKDTIIHIPFTTLDEVYKDKNELFMDLVEFTKGNPALMRKTHKWVLRLKKAISGLEVGINVGVFAINYQFQM